MKCRLFSPQSFFEDNKGNSASNYKFVVGKGSSYFKFGEGLENPLTLQMNTQTKLHQVKAYNSVLSAAGAQALQACGGMWWQQESDIESKALVQVALQAQPLQFQADSVFRQEGMAWTKGTGNTVIDVPHCAACIMGKQTRTLSGTMTSMTVKTSNLSCNMLTSGQVIYSD